MTHAYMHAGTRLLSVSSVHFARRTRISTKVTAAVATLETATKQDVGAAASKSQTHVGLNSGHLMPLFGWGTSGVSDDACIKATKSAMELGYRVSLTSGCTAILNCHIVTVCVPFSCQVTLCFMFLLTASAARWMEGMHDAI